MIILTCGNTGGHVYPAIAVSHFLNKKKLLFIIDKGRISETIIQKHSLPYKTLNQHKSKTIALLRNLTHMYFFLKKNKPSHIYSFGGKTTIPIVLAAWARRIPITLFEQNTIPGRANRLLARFASNICLSSPKSLSFFPKKARVTGNPIRSSYLTDQTLETIINLNWKEGPRCLIFGGSQGAKGINIFISKNRNWFEKNNIQLIHVVGQTYYDKHFANTPYYSHSSNGKTNYVAVPFISNMQTAYLWTHYVISRSGATTIAELLYYKKRALLIPYPYATDDHQTENAKELSEKHLATLCAEKKLNTHILSSFFKQSPLTSPSEDYQKKLRLKWQTLLSQNQ